MIASCELTQLRNPVLMGSTCLDAGKAFTGVVLFIVFKYWDMCACSSWNSSSSYARRSLSMMRRMTLATAEDTSDDASNARSALLSIMSIKWPASSCMARSMPPFPAPSERKIDIDVLRTRIRSSPRSREKIPLWCGSTVSHENLCSSPLNAKSLRPSIASSKLSRLLRTTHGLPNM